MRLSHQQIVVLTAALFLLATALVVIDEISSNPISKIDQSNDDLAQDLLEIPSGLYKEALGAGALTVIALGSEEERHQFAKGLPTQYGRMPIDADAFLKFRLGWSERRIHNLGSALGFSRPWAGR